MGNTCQVAVSSFLVCAEDLRGGTWHHGSIQYPRVSIRLGKKMIADSLTNSDASKLDKVHRSVILPPAQMENLSRPLT